MMILRLTIVLLFVLLLVGCASSVRDTRYLQSEQRPPLKVPSGLAIPQYNEQMQIPRVMAADETEDRDELEYPPTLVDTQ